MLDNASGTFSIRSEQVIARLPPRTVPNDRFVRMLVTMLLLAPLVAQAQDAQHSSPGIAWRVSGDWHVESQKRPLATGDMVLSGSLLRPEEGSRDHSLTVLLPDGQRVLYECFAPQDCARGFRVPSLYRKPEPIALDLMVRVNAASSQKSEGRSAQSGRESGIARDEIVAVLGPGNKVEFGGLAAALSNGTYWYQVRPLSGSAPVQKRQERQEFEKVARLITLTLPSEGLFDVMIVDHSNTARIELLVGAVRQPRAASLVKSFGEVQALLKDWNEDYQGWPIHDLQRDYLQSLMLGIQPASPRLIKTSREGQIGGDGVTAEPVFFPRPGVFRGDTEVTLQPQSPDEVVHYTVDGSQPRNESTVYHAPIMVKGTELTIKAYASSKDKKDSPVVTGIYRIDD